MWQSDVNKSASTDLRSRKLSTLSYRDVGRRKENFNVKKLKQEVKLKFFFLKA